MGRVYAGWALSQTFYREELWRTLGASSLEDYLVTYWETNFARRDPADLLAQFWTWRTATSAPTRSTRATCRGRCAAIQARTLLMPGDHDLYFQVADNRARNCEHLRHAELHADPVGVGPPRRQPGKPARGPGLHRAARQGAAGRLMAATATAGRSLHVRSSPAKRVAAADRASTTGTAALRAFGHLGAIALSSAAAVAVARHAVWALPLTLLQGYLLAFLFNALHETAHQTAFRSRAFNHAARPSRRLRRAAAVRVLPRLPLGPPPLHAGPGKRPRTGQRRCRARGWRLAWVRGAACRSGSAASACCSSHGLLGARRPSPGSRRTSARTIVREARAYLLGYAVDRRGVGGQPAPGRRCGCGCCR